MSETRKRVYNVPYEVYNAPKERGFLHYLERNLKKYVLDRQLATYDLIDSGQRFLDIGCGYGLLVTMAKAKFEEVYGIDFCSSDIKRAKKSIENRTDRERISFLELDVENGLPFDDSFFDAISCVAVLEHIFNPPAMVDEIYRVLKDAGQFIVEVPNFAWLPYRFQLLLGKLPMTGGTDRLGIDWLHVHNFTVSTLCRFLESKGFKSVSTSSSGVFAKYRRWWLSSLSADIIIKTIKSSSTTPKHTTS